MLENQFSEFLEFAEFVQIRMVNDQVKSHMRQVELFYNVVKFLPLQHLQGVTINVKDLIGLDLGMA